VRTARVADRCRARSCSTCSAAADKELGPFFPPYRELGYAASAKRLWHPAIDIGSNRLRALGATNG